ncbi:MAG TPA: hypothetical protein VG937_11895 [Polyangiaceae bacterium]|jgi:hypothetical protein|nr:hypothetical protein [Polyangiaceae bacterium]
MNATKPQSTRPAKTPKASPAPSGTRLRDAEAAKAAPAESGEANDVDFEHHDTIPAPTWFDDGGEASS